MNSTKPRTLIAGTLMIGLATPVLADDVASPSLQQRLQNVTDRLQELEARTDGTPAERMDHEWVTLLEFEAGQIEVEDNEGNAETTSELALATVEVGLTSRIHEGLETNVLLLHEEEAIEVDSATIDANLRKTDDDSTDLIFGRQYLPLGDYYTHFVSDPLTLELGETQEEAIRLHHRVGSLYGGVWMANGETSDTIGNQGAYAHFGMDAGGMKIGFGGAYTSSFADSEGIVETTPAADGIAGYSMMAEAGMGPFTLIAESVSAAKSFDKDALAFDGDGATPSARAIEIAYGITFGAHEFTVAAGTQGTSEAAGLGLPETRTLVGVGLVISGGEVSLEYRDDSNYSTGSGGDGGSENVVTAQLAVAF
jgi:hypothetical protein